MKKLLMLVSSLMLTLLSGCSKFDGNPVTKEFSINNTYTKLNVSHAFNVTVSDAVTQVTVTAGDHIMPKVIVEEKNGKLTIRLKNMTVANNELSALIPYNSNLKDVDLSGASEFHSQRPIVAQKVNIDLSGASIFCADIESTTVDMDLSGASNATIAGTVGTLNLELSGSSDLKQTTANNKYGLVCSSCRGDMSGASSAYIHCDGTISVSLSGSSNLHYTGDASTSGCSTSGSSNVIHDVL